MPTKTDFLRSLPPTTTAAQAVELAKKAGYKTTKQQFYNAKHDMKKTKKKPVEPVVTVKKVQAQPVTSEPIPPEVIKLIVRYGSELIERAIASLSNGGAGRTP
jgi:hypothetical protein